MQKRFTTWLLVLVLALSAIPALAEMPAQDRAGNALALPGTVERVISLAPSITQVILDIDKGDLLIAVDTYSAGTQGLPEGLPAFDMMAPDLEQMIALTPDLVFVSGMSLSGGDDPFAKLADLGIAVAYIPSSGSIDGIMADTLFIGQALGNEEGAQALNDTLAQAIDAVRAQADTPTPVYFEIGSTGTLYTFGSDTFLNEMIEILGGRNVFADQASWLAVSDEAVLAAAPQIIFTNEDWKEDAVADILVREGWDSIPAVQDGKVFLIGGDVSSQPNHRIVYALEEMAKAF